MFYEGDRYLFINGQSGDRIKIFCRSESESEFPFVSVLLLLIKQIVKYLVCQNSYHHLGNYLNNSVQFNVYKYILSYYHVMNKIIDHHYWQSIKINNNNNNQITSLELQ